MNLPNKLTFMRIALVPVIIVVYLLPYDYLGIKVMTIQLGNASLSIINIITLLLFIVASLTDYFDGQIARKNNLITTFGKFADPIADKLLVNTIFLLLASKNMISILVPIIMISRDIIVDAIRLVAANKQVVIAAKPLGKLKTVAQMVAICVLLLNNFPFAYIDLPIHLVLVGIACIISIISGIDYFISSKDMLLESI